MRPWLLLPLLLAAAPLAAQGTSPAAGWHTLLTRDDGTVVSIDSATVDRTGDSTFTVRTAVRFPRPVATAMGDSVDLRMETEDLDCASGRSRPLVLEMYAGTGLLRRTSPPQTWAAVDPGRRAVFDAECAYLLGGFAARLPRSYDARMVEEAPELTNRGAVSAALSREYPRGLRAMGQTGTVTLRFRVLEDGRVDRPTIEVEHFTHPDFAQAAVRVVYAMRFRPAKIRHVPVQVWVSLPVTFQLAYGPGTTQPGDPPAIPPLPRRP
jgi:TonB family protein